MKHLFIYIVMLLTATVVVAENTTTSVQRQVIIKKVGDNCLVSMQVDPNVVKMQPNRQIFITPYLESGDGSNSVMFPSVVLSGRNMHYVYLRSGETKATGKTQYKIATEILANGKAELYNYNESVPMQPWMYNDDTALRISVDTCGCGDFLGNDAGTPLLAHFNPISEMLWVPYPTPVTEVPKIINHHGKARVEFEVDKFELHESVYSYTHRITKRKHVIDNRAELKVIDDSINYALSNPYVEIDRISLCGYASPESPYLHNDYLATNRSRALAQYISKHYNLPQERCTYNAVPENWAGFREQTLASKDINDNERTLLLSLIDRPAYGPADYDKKEKELQSDKKYARMYKEFIHPDWFPKLRYTDFVIQTRLNPLTMEQLHETLAKNPELLSLNQIYTIANDCEHGSEEFCKAMAAALKYYPDDETANCNAAALAIEQKEYAKAAEYLKKAGDNDVSNVLRGIVEVSNRNNDKALEYFEMAKKTKEAQRNIQILTR